MLKKTALLLFDGFPYWTFNKVDFQHFWTFTIFVLSRKVRHFFRETLKYSIFCCKNLIPHCEPKKWQICAASRLYILCTSGQEPLISGCGLVGNEPISFLCRAAQRNACSKDRGTQFVNHPPHFLENFSANVSWGLGEKISRSKCAF